MVCLQTVPNMAIILVLIVRVTVCLLLVEATSKLWSRCYLDVSTREIVKVNVGVKK